VYVFFLFNRTTLQVFVTYPIGALYVHTLWFYKHQHDSRVRSKLYVACQRWWFQWQFWFVPSVPGYLREEEEVKPDPWRNPIERNHMGLHLENEMYCVWQVVKTPTIILNNPVQRDIYLIKVENGRYINSILLLKDVVTAAFCVIILTFHSSLLSKSGHDLGKVSPAFYGNQLGSVRL